MVILQLEIARHCGDSSISSADGGGFKPTLGSQWVPFLSGNTSMGASGKRVRRWIAQTLTAKPKRYVQEEGNGSPLQAKRKPVSEKVNSHVHDRFEPFFAMKPASSEEESEEIQPPQVVPPLKESAWEDDCTLQ